MRIKMGVTIEGFIEQIQGMNKKIICYGAGLVALSTEHIFENANIANRVHAFVDRDNKKAGTSVNYNNREISIIGIDELIKLDLSDKVLLLTLEVFGSVIEELDKYSELSQLPCYIFTELNKSYIASCAHADLFSNANISVQIPKVIHYAWLGEGEKPTEILECIDSWKKQCPDYEIVCWNEDNYDVYQNRYMRESYKAKKYAFTADFLRLDILYRHGGIYLDTDVKLLQSLDTVLHNQAFAVYLEWAVPTFAICGCRAGLPIFKELRDNPRSTLPFLEPDGTYNQKISSYYEVDILEKYGFRKDFSPQTIKDLTMYPPQYFSISGRLGLCAPITERTIGVHYCYRTWADSNRKKEIDATTAYANRIMKL